MQHHLERRVSLSESSEFESLYNWSLQELDAEGAKIGRDLIPWNWSLTFTAIELSYSEGLTIRPEYGGGGKDAPMATRQRRFISAKMMPGSPYERQHNCAPSYSLFGTDRRITTFEVFIEALSAENEQERCSASGSVSYTTEVDFRNETTDDFVTFHLHVRPDTFERYVRSICAAEVDIAILRLGRVAGFYSEWSPAISTDIIRVLSGYKDEHPIEVPKGSEIDPPRLGDVGEATLTLLRTLTFQGLVPKYVKDDSWRDEDELSDTLTDNAPAVAQNSMDTRVRTVALLTSLRTAAWAIAFLLFLKLVI